MLPATGSAAGGSALRVGELVFFHSPQDTENVLHMHFTSFIFFSRFVRILVRSVRGISKSTSFNRTEDHFRAHINQIASDS